MQNQNTEMLEVVSEQDIVIGLEPRTRVHAEGLLHREANVIFITPNKEIIFQKRGANVDTFPGILTMAVGGHVEPGSTYLQTAIKETHEETGLQLQGTDLVPVVKRRARAVDAPNNKINNRFSQIYAHLYKGKIEDLVFEPGKCEGYIAIAHADLLKPEIQIMHKFPIDFFVEGGYTNIIAKAMEVLL